MKKRTILWVSIAIVAVALLRKLMPSDTMTWANFSPIGAIALMGAALIKDKVLRFVLPLGGLFVGDLILSQMGPSYSSYLFSGSFLSVYLAFGLVILLGASMKKLSLVNVLGGSLLAAIAFFLITNTGSWITDPMYPKTGAGLFAAIEAGIPFFRNTLVSQLVFSLAAYGMYVFATNRKPVIA